MRASSEGQTSIEASPLLWLPRRFKKHINSQFTAHDAELSQGPFQANGMTFPDRHFNKESKTYLQSYL